MFLAAKKESDKIVKDSFYDETKDGRSGSGIRGSKSPTSRRNVRTAPGVGETSSVASFTSGGMSGSSVRFSEDDADIVDTQYAFG